MKVEYHKPYLVRLYLRIKVLYCFMRFYKNSILMSFLKAILMVMGMRAYLMPRKLRKKRNKERD